MSTVPKVSVIIPSYQRQATIARAINSVLIQNYEALEVIVVDDGSQDETGAIVTALSESDHRIRYHYQPNGGPASARNQGVSLAQAEYLAFLDADDEWLPDKLAAQIEILDRCVNIDVVFTDSRVNMGQYNLFSQINARILEQLTFLPLTVPGVSEVYQLAGPVRQMLYSKYFIHLSSVVMRRSSFDRTGGFDPVRFGTEDIDLMCRLSSWGDFAYWKEAKTIYHQDESGLSWISEGRLRELVNYHRACFASANYSDLQSIVKVNLAKIYAMLIMYHARNWQPFKAVQVFQQSLAYGFRWKLLMATILSFFGPPGVALVTRFTGRQL